MMARAREAASPPARAPPRARSRMLRHRARPGRQAHRPRTTTATRTTALSALKNRRTAHPPENSNGPLEAPIPSPKDGPETRTAWRAPFLDQKGVTNSPVTPFWPKIGARLAAPNSGPRGRTQRGARDAPQKQSHGPRDTHTHADEVDGDARGTAPRRTPRAFPHGAGSGSPRRTGRTRGQRDRYAKQVRRGQHRETEVAQNVHVHVRAGTPHVAATAVACDGRHQCMGKCLHAVRRMQRDAQCQRTGAHARHTSMLHCTPSTLRRPRSACGKAYFVVT